MRPGILSVLAIGCAAVGLAGCATGEGGLLPTTTASLPANAATTAAATKRKAEHANMCADLQARIRMLNADATIGRVEKAATGKTRSVMIKRAALSKVVELNTANAEYQAKCAGPTRAVAPTKAGLKTANAATPAQSAVAAKPALQKTTAASPKTTAARVQ